MYLGVIVPKGLDKNARRSFLNRIYSRNRKKTAVKVDDAPTDAPVPVADDSSREPVGGSIHWLTNELYKLGGVNKELINTNQILKNKVHLLEQEVKSLQIKLKNKDFSLKLMNVNGYRQIDR